MEKIVVGAGAARFNWLPVFVAERLGLLEEAGLELEVVRTGAVDKATAAVRDGDIDLAITPPEGAIRDAVDGGGLRLIAGNANALPLTLVADPRFTTVESLRGARLGTSSLTEGTALYTMEMLRQHGLVYPGDYEFVLAGVHPARWAALQNGTIDAAVQPAPLNLIAIDAGYSDLGELDEYVGPIVFSAVIGDAAHMAGKTGEVLRFLTAVRQATEIFYRGDHDSLLSQILQDIGEADEAHVQRAIGYLRDKGTFSRDLSIPAPAFSKTVELMVKAGVLAPADAARAGRAIDTGFLAELGAP